MTAEQKELAQRHLLNEGAPLSAEEYRRLRGEMAADPELARYFNQLAETSVDGEGNPVMSRRQYQTILSAAQTRDRRNDGQPARHRRAWLGGVMAAAGSVAILALVVSRNTGPSAEATGKPGAPGPSGSVVFRGAPSVDGLPALRCGETALEAETASCPPGAVMQLQGALFPPGINRAHLTIIACDQTFACDLVQQRQQAGNESAVVFAPRPARPLRVFAAWTEEVFTAAQLSQAAERLKLAGLDLRQSPQLPVGRAKQVSIYLTP